CADWKNYCETWNQAAVRLLLLSKDRKYWSVFALCCKPNRSPGERKAMLEQLRRDQDGAV
ncbi:hypothetical protein, partial [Paenibacillus sp. EKM202P]|uniref:hypothetical protein n=1 Tax=Paenibacillus sp. EKM202P TaxID=1683670 RepID=UPI001EEB8CDB